MRPGFVPHPLPKLGPVVSLFFSMKFPSSPRPRAAVAAVVTEQVFVPSAATMPQKIGFLRAFGRYMTDPSASHWGKLLVVGAAAYVVMPADAIPDVAPIIGWLDDAGVVGIAVAFLSRVLGEYRDAASPSPAAPLAIEPEAAAVVATPER